MRIAWTSTAASLCGASALAFVLSGCPDKGSASDKVTAEPEQAETDDQGKLDAKGKKPAAADKDEKADEAKDGKDEGGW